MQKYLLFFFLLIRKQVSEVGQLAQNTNLMRSQASQVSSLYMDPEPENTGSNPAPPLTHCCKNLESTVMASTSGSCEN